MNHVCRRSVLVCKSAIFPCSETFFREEKSLKRVPFQKHKFLCHEYGSRQYQRTLASKHSRLFNNCLFQQQFRNSSRTIITFFIAKFETTLRYLTSTPIPTSWCMDASTDVGPTHNLYLREVGPLKNVNPDTNQTSNVPRSTINSSHAPKSNVLLSMMLINRVSDFGKKTRAHDFIEYLYLNIILYYTIFIIVLYFIIVI